MQTITNPAGERWRIDYVPGRPYLIQAISDPLDRATTYHYDTYGRYRSETDPEGGGWTRTDLGGQRYRMETAEGVATDYTIEHPAHREQIVTVDYPVGPDLIKRSD